MIVETELVVGAVSYVCHVLIVSGLSFYRVYDAAYPETEERVEFAHPLRVSLGQVIVDCNDVYAAPLKCVEVCRQSRDQSLTFTCLHLGNAALMKYYASDELHSEMLHSQRTPCCLAAYGECFRQNVIEGLALSKSRLEFPGLSSKLII